MSQYWLHDIEAGRAFGGVVLVADGDVAADEFAHAELWNPDGSGINAYIHIVHVGGNGFQYSLCFHDVALRDVHTTVRNLRTGRGAPACQLRSLPSTTMIGDEFNRLDTPAEVARRFPVEGEWAAILEPGEGFVYGNRALDIGLTVNFSWMEFPL